MSDETVALIVAGGRGSRATREMDDAPKQYVIIHDLPLLVHTLRPFLESTRIDKVLVVIHADDVDSYQACVHQLATQQQSKLLAPQFGGDTRQQSVLAGLTALEALKPHSVLIHDAARPCVSQQLIDDICLRLIDLNRDIISVPEKAKGLIPAIAVADTLKRVEGNSVVKTVDRASLWRAQTPQAFLYSSILAAHRAAEVDDQQAFTDDASIAEWFGLSVALIEGDERNIKITTAQDFERGAFYLTEMGRDTVVKDETVGQDLDQTLKTRIGNGFDVHAFEAGDAVILCGETIPFDKKLKGHSDADVGLHAITDALYGALGEGDIGQHFPPTDPQWKGVASDVFLKHAVQLLIERKGEVSNVDLTLICEAPKIGPYSDVMRRNVAEIMELEVAQVSVKATTSERLGFTGREEGIAALATVAILV